MKQDSLISISVTASSKSQDILSLDGKSHLVYGAKKEINGWASLINSGIMGTSSERLLGATLKFEVKLAVTSVEVPFANPDTVGLTLVGNSSDITVQLFKESSDDPFMKGVEDILSEESKEGHRFTGFMENPKDL